MNSTYMHLESRTAVQYLSTDACHCLSPFDCVMHDVPFLPVTNLHNVVDLLIAESLNQFDRSSLLLPTTENP